MREGSEPGERRKEKWEIKKTLAKEERRKVSRRIERKWKDEYGYETSYSQKNDRRI